MWTNAATGALTFSVGYTVEPSWEDGWILILRYTLYGQDIELGVPLQTTRPKRWWLTCPLWPDGKPCSRRVGKLYLPPRELCFGCRRCHDLTYRSAQEHDKRVDALLRPPRTGSSGL